jgi:sterol desaturase/sphingolipid hydroxylase (fatty acid hydroxylase superfamily)
MITKAMWSLQIWVCNVVVYWILALNPDFFRYSIFRQKRIVKRVLTNQLCVEVPTLMTLEWFLLESTSSFSWKKFSIELGAFMAIAEVTFYGMHRLFHTPWLYHQIHRKHHIWVTPIMASSSDAHPIEHLFVNLLPILTGPLFLQSHPNTILLWSLLCTVNTLIAHSRKFDFHDTHHHKIHGNYGILGWCDDWFGTRISKK